MIDNPSEVTLEPYTTAEGEDCLAMVDANGPRYFGPGDREEFATFLSDPQGQYWILREPGGTVVGCGGASTRGDGRTGVLSWMLIHPDYQGKGLGSRLMEASLDYLREIPGIERVVLETSNESASFYERFGFRTTRVMENHWAPGLHRHDMELDLSETAGQ